jgi:hypothetical protein
VVDEARKELQAQYRQTTVARPIEGEGMGMRMTIPTKEIPQPGAIMQAEDIYSKEQGMPVRFIFLNPDEVTSAKILWQIVVTPREKKTSETQKLMFRAEMQDAMMFGPMLNIGYLGERFASVWEENPQKMFKTPEQLQQEQMMAQQQANQQNGKPSKTVSPGTNLPSPEKAMGNQIKNTLATG